MKTALAIAAVLTIAAGAGLAWWWRCTTCCPMPPAAPGTVLTCKCRRVYRSRPGGGWLQISAQRGAAEQMYGFDLEAAELLSEEAGY